MANEFNDENKGFSFEDENIDYHVYRKNRHLSQRNSFDGFKIGEENTYRVDDNEAGKVKNGFIVSLFEWLDVVAISVIAVVIVFTFLFRIVLIDGDSMLNTLHDGERVIISNLFYTPKRGDIIVISRNTENSSKSESVSKPIIKRVIATEGETININFETGVVTVNGTVLYEPYIKELTYEKGDVEFPVRVPENCVFVLGDNRNNSSDSRFSELGENGMVNEKYILGKAIFRVSPTDKMGGLYSENE